MTDPGLEVIVPLVTQVYQKGLAVAEEVRASLRITDPAACPQWRYTIKPEEQSGLG